VCLMDVDVRSCKKTEPRFSVCCSCLLAFHQRSTVCVYFLWLHAFWRGRSEGENQMGRKKKITRSKLVFQLSSRFAFLSLV
jgi:hypothetical protein